MVCHARSSSTEDAMKTNVTPSAQLAFFAAELNYDDIPTEVMRRAEEDRKSVV